MKNFVSKKYQKYLPSKKFTYLIIGCLIVGILTFTFLGVFSKKNYFQAENKKNKLQNTNLTLNNLLQKDSDEDGLMDWEEALWGTDPNKKTTFNMLDSEYVETRRERLRLANETSTDVIEDLTETDRFAQELFASIIAIKQSGKIGEDAIENVTTALSQGIIDSNIIEKYTEENIKIDELDDINRQEKYYLNGQELFSQYAKKGIGNELELVSAITALGKVEGSEEIINQLNLIADAYQEYAEKMTKIPVPESLIKYHIRIINSANNTGIATRNMTKIIIDPVVGLSGVSQYQKYSEDLISSVAKLEAFLINNGIGSE